MDDLLRDPELAPQVVKLLNDRLQEMRKVLEALKKENEAYRTENERLQNSAGAGKADIGDQQLQLQAIQRELADVREVNHRLQAEKADLLGIIEGYTSTQGINNHLADDDMGECSTRSCPARQTSIELGAEIDGLRTQLDNRNVAYEELQQRVEELQEKLKAQEAMTREQQVDPDDTCEQVNHDTNQATLDEKVVYLRQQSQAAEKNYQRCENQLRDMIRKQEEQPEEHVCPLGNSQVGQGSITPQQSNAQSSTTIERNRIPSSVQQDQEWFKIVNYVLSRPCLPLSIPTAPFQIPQHIKEIMGTATIMSAPHRILYPYSEGFARLVTPLAQCKGADRPLEFNPPTNRLRRLVGGTREMFYHSTSGICYAGTFVCTAVGEVDRSEYASFERPTKDAIIKLTFMTSNAFTNATKSDQDRLRNWYIAGKAKVQYLELRYIGFNKPFFHAIMNLGLMNEGTDPSSVLTTKRSASAMVLHPEAKKIKVA